MGAPRAPSEWYLGAQGVHEGALDSPDTGFGEARVFDLLEIFVEKMT